MISKRAVSFINFALLQKKSTIVTPHTKDAMLFHITPYICLCIWQHLPLESAILLKWRRQWDFLLMKCYE